MMSPHPEPALRTLVVLLAVFALAAPAHATSRGKTKRSAKETEQAKELVSSGDILGGFQKVNHAIQLDPGNVDALLFRAALLFQASVAMSDPSDSAEMARAARTDLTEIVRIAPDSDAGKSALAVLGQMRGGELFPEPKTDCSPEAQATLNQAEAAWQKHDFIAAESAYARATAACPANPVWWTWYGDVYFSQEEYARASEMYSQAITVSPCYWSAHRFLSDAQRKSGNEAGAYHSITHAVACNPLYEDAWNDLAVITANHGGTLVRPTFSLPTIEAKEDGTSISLPALGKQAEDAEESLEQQVGLVYALAVQASDGTTPLAKRRDAVHVTLGYLGPERLAGTFARPGLQAWQVLGRAEAAGLLDEAIAILMVDAELVPEVQDLQAAHVDRLIAFVEQFVAPVPDLAGK